MAPKTTELQQGEERVRQLQKKNRSRMGGGEAGEGGSRRRREKEYVFVYSCIHIHAQTVKTISFGLIFKILNIFLLVIRLGIG